MKLKQQILSLKPYQPGRSIDEVKRQYNLEKIIKLASNENPFGCSEEVTKALKNISVPTALYPDGYVTNLRMTLANFLGVEPNQLLFGSGSDEIIRIISRAILDSNSNTVMAAPTFPQYRHNAVIEGAEIREVPLINGEHNLQGMLDQIDQNTRVVWVCSPNNPTGNYINEVSLVSFLNNVPPHVLVVLDEAYYEYVDAPDYYDSIQLLKRFENLMVLRTFSKIYGLAGLRIGYAIGSSTIISGIEPVREPFNVNFIAQISAEAAIKDQKFVEKCKKANREGLQQFYNFCTENNLSFYPSQGNFILIDFNVDGDEIFQYLLEKGFIVRSGKGLGFPTAVRITVGLSEHNEALLKTIKQYLDQRLQAPIK